MKKLKTILTLALAFGFLTSVSLTSCGGKKEEAAATDETEMEHPAEGGEHPSDGGSEHPAQEDGDTAATDSTTSN